MYFLNLNLLDLRLGCGSRFAVYNLLGLNDGSLRLSNLDLRCIDLRLSNLDLRSVDLRSNLDGLLECSNSSGSLVVGSSYRRSGSSNTDRRSLVVSSIH